MLIKFTESVAGARFAYRPGERVELEPAIAREFLRAGQAVPAEPEAAIETATAPRQAAGRGGRRGRLASLLG